MLIMAVISPGLGSGKNAVLVNLGIGLQRKGYRVLLVTEKADCVIGPWLNPISPKEIGPGAIVETTSLNVDLLKRPGDAPGSTYLTILNGLYDYLLVDAGSYQPDVCREIFTADIIIACIEAGIQDSRLFELEKQLRGLSQGARGIDLIIPSKARAGEWESNLEQITQLSEYFGEDRITDFIPFCEAIHDLPKEKKAVWDLPGHYSNRKQAFDRLVDKILEQTSPERGFIPNNRRDGRSPLQPHPFSD